ncbi:hypothetical protein AMECASPLE_022282 [Ameca splendens]|uniref:Secreted protein n=1 Tax=Ameca splendens TaxID=208324 RepID=A0ABV0YS29_9TELE
MFTKWTNRESIIYYFIFFFISVLFQLSDHYRVGAIDCLIVTKLRFPPLIDLRDCAYVVCRTTINPLGVGNERNSQKVFPVPTVFSFNPLLQTTTTKTTHKKTLLCLRTVSPTFRGFQPVRSYASCIQTGRVKLK